MRIAILATFLLQVTTAQAPPFEYARLAVEAEKQRAYTTGYDGTYRALAYPGGDVPLSTGVCTDVVIRAYRALGIDLQKLVHEDMRRNFSHYPKLWGRSAPDRNIDHRRVPNLQAFFSRHGESLPVSTNAGDYKAGELVTWDLAYPRHAVPHIGIVTGQKSPAGRPLIAHNIGGGVQVEDILFSYKITGHYRYPRR